MPHRGSEVWGLHAILALADKPLAEGGRPWITWVQGEPEIHDGTIGPPSGPGFGVTFDEALLVEARPRLTKRSGQDWKEVQDVIAIL